jgi:hypothetical protein
MPEPKKYPPTIQRPTSKTQTIEISAGFGGECKYTVSKPVMGGRACIISGKTLESLKIAGPDFNNESTSTSGADSVPVRIKSPKGVNGREIAVTDKSHCNAVQTVRKNIACSGLAPCGDDLAPGSCDCDGVPKTCNTCPNGEEYLDQTSSNEKIIKQLADVNLYNQGLLDQAQRHLKSDDEFVFQIMSGGNIKAEMTGSVTIQYVLKGGQQGSVSFPVDASDVIAPPFGEFDYTLGGVVDTVVYTQQGFKPVAGWECVAEAPGDSRPQPGDRRGRKPSTGGCVVARKRGARIDPHSADQFKVACGQLVIKILPGWDAYNSRSRTNSNGSKTYDWNMRAPITQDKLFPSGSATLGTMANDADYKVTNPGLTYTTGTDGGTDAQLQAFLRQNGVRPFQEFEGIRDGVRDAIRTLCGTVYTKFQKKIDAIVSESPFNNNSCIMATSWTRSACTISVSPFAK